MRGILRNGLPVQEPQQIAQPREADQAFIGQRRAEGLPCYENRGAQPGACRAPVLDDLWPIVLDALCKRTPARFIDGMLVGARNSHPAECDAGEFRVFPLNAGPIDKLHNSGERVIYGVIVEELLEHVERTIEAYRLDAGPVVRDVGRKLLFDNGPVDHRLTLPRLRHVQFASRAPKSLKDRCSRPIHHRLCTGLCTDSGDKSRGSGSFLLPYGMSVPVERSRVDEPIKPRGGGGRGGEDRHLISHRLAAASVCTADANSFGKRGPAAG